MRGGAPDTGERVRLTSIINLAKTFDSIQLQGLRRSAKVNDPVVGKSTVVDTICELLVLGQTIPSMALCSGFNNRLNLPEWCLAAPE
jgi:hypothetical protein